MDITILYSHSKARKKAYYPLQIFWGTSHKDMASYLTAVSFYSTPIVTFLLEDDLWK